MSAAIRPARVNFKILIIIAVVLAFVGGGTVAVHYVRKRTIAGGALKEGRAAITRQDWSEACKHLRRYLSRYPDDTPVLEEYGQAQLKIRPTTPDTLASAISAYRRVLRSRPSDRELSRQLIKLYARTGQYDQADSMYGRLTDPDDESTVVWARAMLAQLKIPEARAKLERMIAKPPSPSAPGASRGERDRIEGLVLLAEIALRGGTESDRAAAQRYVDRAVEADPASARARVKRAEFLRVIRNDPAGAKADLEVAEELLSAARARGPQAAPPDILHDLAEEWLNLGQFDRAAADIDSLQRFEDAALEDEEIDPRAFALARYNLAAGLVLARGTPQEASDIAQRALADLHDSARALFLPTAVELYVRADRSSDARRCLDEYREAVRSTSKQADRVAEPLEALDALVMLTEHRAAEASARLEALVARSPQNVQAWRLLAIAAEIQAQPRRAARAWEEYAARVPGDAWVIVRLTKLFAGYDWKKTVGYAEATERAGIIDPTVRRLRIEGLLELGPTAAQLSELAPQLAALREQNPQDAKLQLLAARLDLAQNRGDQAISELESDLKSSDDPTTIALQLARFYADRGDRDRALQVCRAAIERQPDSAAPRAALAELQRRGDQNDDARKTLLQAVTDLRGDERWRAQTALAKLLLMIQDRPGAINLLRQGMAERPEDIGAPLILLALPEIQSQPDEAANLVGRLKKIEGESGPNYRVEQCVLWLRGEDWRDHAQQIAAMMNDCLSSDAQWAPAALVLGDLLERLGEMEKAERVYRQAIDPANADMRPAERLLALLERQSRYPEAEELLRRLPADLPTLSRHRVGVAVARKNYEAAIEPVQARVAADPRDAESRVLLARLIYSARHDAPAAFKLLDEADSIAPQEPAALSARIAILHEADRQSEALALLNEQVTKRNDFNTVLLRAQYYELLGQAEQAEQDYRHLLNFNDKAPAGHEALGRFYERSGRGAEALQAWRAGLQKSPDNSALQRLLVKQELSSDDPEQRAEARALLQRLSSGAPDDPEVLALRSAALLADNSAESNAQAEPVLERVIALAPQHVAAQVAYVRLARQRGDLKTAGERIATALAANPECVPLMLEQAQLQAESGDLDAGRRLANEALRRDDKNLDGYRLLVTLALRAGDIASARASTEAALKINPSDPVARVSAAEILAHEGRRTEAIAALDQIRPSVNGAMLVDVLLALAQLYRLEGDLATCGQRLDDAARIAPRQPEVLVARMRWLGDQNRFDDIIALTSTDSRNPPLDPGSMITAALILSETGQERLLRAADDIFVRLIARDPKRVEGHIGRAQVAYRLHDLDACEAAYQRVLAIDPDHEQALNDLAWIIGHERGKPDRGLELANRAILRYPDNANLLDTRGVLLTGLGRYDEARHDLEKCLAQPNTPAATRAVALLHLGRVYLKVGEVESARAKLAQASELDRENKFFTPDERAEINRIIRPQ